MSGIADQAKQALKKGHLFLEASAGTGKTYSIIEIIKALLRSGVSLENLAVITFTEKAAGELSERIRSGLEEEIQTRPESAGFYNQNLEKLPYADIGTIHQFCRNLLGKNPESSDFFSLKEEERSIKIRIQEAFSKFIEKQEAEAIQKNKEEEFIDFFYKFEVEILEDFCIDVIQKTKGKKISLAKSPTEPEVLAEMRSLFSEIPKEVPGSKLAEALKTRIPHPEILDQLINEKFLSKDYAINKTTNKDIKTHTEFERWNCKFQELKPAMDFAKNLPYIESLIKFINNFIDFFQDYQTRESFISTDGIIQITKNMLLEYPETRRKIAEEYEYLIVDECQDTDPDQFLIFELIGEPLQKDSKVPKLIFVGDKKQSIYKFRNADLKTVTNTISKLVPKENRILLDTSYRGTKNLTEGFNLIFSSLKSSSFAYEKVNAGRDDEVALSNSPAVYLGFANPAEEIKTDRARELCYEQIASFISYAKDNPEFLIWDKGSKKKRLSRFSDMAVLGYSRKDLSNLQNFLLSHNIPCSIYKEKDYYEDPIVNALSYILHSIENPNDTTSFYFALQSPFFLIQTGLLSKLSTENNLTYLSDLPSSPEFKEIYSIYKAFRKARSERYMFSASYIVQRLLEEFDCVPKIASGFEGRKNLTNLYHYYEILDELQYSHAYSFGEMAREMRNRVQSGLEGEKKIDFEEKDPNQDVVRLMTVHSAKGLEFPICLMLSLFKNGNSHKEVFYVHREQQAQEKDKKVEFSLRATQSVQTYSYKNLADQNTKETEEEEERVFYVGLTRARDFLFLPVVFPGVTNKLTPFSKRIQENFSQTSELVTQILNRNIGKIYDIPLFQKNQKEERKTEIKKIHPDSLYKKIPETAKIENMGVYKVISYSSLHTKSKSPEKTKTETQEEYPKFGAEFGQACHEVLELIPLELIAQPKKLDKELRKLCSEVFKDSRIKTKNLDYNEDKLFELSKKALLHKYKIEEKTTQISDWQYVTKERKFYSPGERLGDLLLGIGDIFFFYNNKYYILDWKTDNQIHKDGFLAHSFDKYIHQMYIYSWILVKNLALAKGKSTIQEWKEVYETEFGGMLYVYLRHLDHPDGVTFLKLPKEEIIQFIIHN